MISSMNQLNAEATNKRKLLYKSQTGNKSFFSIDLEVWSMKGLVTINQSAQGGGL